MGARPSQARRCRSHGFTAVELLAASALAVLLIVSVMGIVGQVANSQSNLIKHHPSHTWKMRLRSQLEKDFSNTRRIVPRGSEIVLKGFGSSDMQTGIAKLGPSRITYQIRGSGKETWLVRRETRLDLPPGQNTWSEICCYGVTHFDLLYFDKYTERWESLAGARSSMAYLNIPARCRLIVRGAASDEPLVDVVLVRHGV